MKTEEDTQESTISTRGNVPTETERRMKFGSKMHQERWRQAVRRIHPDMVFITPDNVPAAGSQGIELTHMYIDEWKEEQYD